MAERRQWWVTVLVDRQRTRDVLVVARSEWSAGWLFRHLHPGVEVLGVGPVPGQ